MQQTRILSPRECVAEAIGKVVMDFREWISDETLALSRWKNLEKGYAVAPGKMVNQVDDILNSLRKAEVGLPIVVIAVQNLQAPPGLDQVIGTPWGVKTVIKKDPLKRPVVLRTEPRAYHVQLIFLANDPDSVNAFASQFCSYVRLMEKRRFPVSYFLSPDLRDDYDMTIFDNTLYPDSASFQEENIHGGLVEFDISGLTPQVKKGLPPLYPDTPDSGSTEPEPGWYQVVSANLFKDRPSPTYIQVNADPTTGEISQEIINK